MAETNKDVPVMESREPRTSAREARMAGGVALTMTLEGLLVEGMEFAALWEDDIGVSGCII